jgi:RNA polymerase sigma factor (sigma-70 family)
MSDEIALQVPRFGASPHATRGEIREAVTQLYEHRQIIFRSLAAYTRNPAIAEELTQEAFFRLYQHLIGGNVVEKALSWTLAVARNLATDRLRKGKCEQAVTEEAWQHIIETRTDAAASFEQVLIHRDTHQRLRALVEILPAPQRSCVQLYAGGLSFKEIADALNIPYHHALHFTRDGLQRVRRVAGQTKL